MGRAYWPFYSLCVYAGTSSALVAQASAPRDSTRWSYAGKGLRYSDADGTAGGLSKMILKWSTADAAKIVLKGKGANLSDPAIPLALPVTVRLLNSQSGLCWEATCATAASNAAGVFKARSP